jgi:hypothetical protein
MILRDTVDGHVIKLLTQPRLDPFTHRSIVLCHELVVYLVFSFTGEAWHLNVSDRERWFFPSLVRGSSFKISVAP